MGATFVDGDKHIAQLCNQRCGGVHAKHTHLSLMAVWPHVVQVLGASSNLLSQQKGRTGRNRHQEKPPLEIVRDFSRDQNARRTSFPCKRDPYHSHTLKDSGMGMVSRDSGMGNGVGAGWK